MLLHASAVAIGGRAVLLTGASGRGKSDLALRLIDRGAVLIADDQVQLTVDDLWLLASPPASIAGMIEVRGIGIVEVPWSGGVPVALLVDLDGQPQRLPMPVHRILLDRSLPVLALAAFEASAPLKVEHALTRAVAGVEALP